MLIFADNNLIDKLNITADNGIKISFQQVLFEMRFLFCMDETYQYIIDGETKRILYKKDYKKYGQSVFCYCGDTENGPAFYDARYSTYLYPTKDGYKAYDGLFNLPIIVNHINAVNVTEDDNGIGLIDSFGTPVLENNYDKISVQLQITATKDGKQTQKIISFSKNRFEKGDLPDVDSWA